MYRNFTPAQKRTANYVTSGHRFEQFFSYYTNVLYSFSRDHRITIGNTLSGCICQISSQRGEQQREQSLFVRI